MGRRKVVKNRIAKELRNSDVIVATPVDEAKDLVIGASEGIRRVAKYMKVRKLAVRGRATRVKMLTKVKRKT